MQLKKKKIKDCEFHYVSLILLTPCQQKYSRSNHLPFMNKTISKETMKRTRLRKKLHIVHCTQILKNRTDENKSRHTKQRNHCVSILRKTKIHYHSSLDEKNYTVIKKFWKTVKPFLSDKVISKVSEIFERYMFCQTNEYMDVFLSRHQCGFRKGYNTQQCLLAMLEKWRSAVDNKKTLWGLLTDLSKTFDCLSHERLLAKLHAYRFSIPALKLVYSF